MDWSLKEEETRQGRVRRSKNEGLIRFQRFERQIFFQKQIKNKTNLYILPNTSLFFRIHHRDTKQTNGSRPRLQKHHTGKRFDQEWIHSIRTFILRFVGKKLKETIVFPLLSLSLFPRFSAHDTRGKRREDLSVSADSSRARHVTVAILLPGGRRRCPQFPVPSEEEAARGLWVDERGYAARWGRLVTDSLSPGVATPTPPLRHPSASLSPSRPSATPSTHRPLRGCPFSRARRASHVLCIRAYRTLSLSLFLPLSVYFSLCLSLSSNERSAPERSRTQGCWPAVTHPSAGCHSIYSLEDRAGGLEDDGIVAGWELWGRWELEISSLLDFDVDVGFSESRGRVWNAGPFFFFFFWTASFRNS